MSQTSTTLHPSLHPLDKTRIRASFNAAAEHYDEAAVLQHEVGNRMLERLDLIRLAPHTILDVGAGTGALSRALGRRYSAARVMSLDLAPRMLMVARRHNGWFSRHFGKQKFICADAESLPIADRSVDLILSNLTLQWCATLDQAFAEFRRVLKPQGLLMFSTFGPDTLKELRYSWQAADADQSTTVHVNDFIDMHDVGDALLRCGMRDAVMDAEHFTLMRELKTIGAHNAAQQRPQGLTGKQRMKNMLAAYEQFRSNGKLPATYEVIYGHAWNLPVSQQQNTAQHFSIPAASIKTLVNPS
jgi:malonyl-CoA O-methyltransferase